MTAITVGKRYINSTRSLCFTVKCIGENVSFIRYDTGLEAVTKNENFYNGLFIEFPETRKVTVYLHENGVFSYNQVGNAIASRVVEFEIGKFEKEDEK